LLLQASLIDVPLIYRASFTRLLLFDEGEIWTYKDYNCYRRIAAITQIWWRASDPRVSWHVHAVDLTMEARASLPARGFKLFCWLVVQFVWMGIRLK
jgi:hypothetical protein